MKTSYHLLYLIALSALFTNVSLEAQQMPRMYFVGSQKQEVSFSQFSATAYPEFLTIFAASSQHSAVQNVSFVVKNRSSKSIIGLAFKYKIIDFNAHETPYTLKTHSYLSSSASPMMEPGEQMLVSPDSFISESLIRPGHGIAGTVPRAQTIAKFSNASEIYVSIDAVIFDDGEVTGPNELQLAQAMQDLKYAADVIQRQVNASRPAHQDPRDSIVQLQATPHLAGDPVAKHISHLSRLLLSTKDFEFTFDYIKKIQSQPTLFRKDGLPL
ncbi:MAG TPA: hypothetical protein VGJ30_01855 [Candidatus Angelobacter sp.]|jgi:hypothetical protein